NAHMYQILLPTPERRAAFIEAMRGAGIITPFHYVPLHSAPAGQRFGRTSGPLSVTDDIAARLVRLPMYAGVDKEQDAILSAVVGKLG
ncbi:MAG: DegT/DnrJ/EryC1/StrS family aminotransferase, partial [Litorimonas sp.]